MTSLEKRSPNGRVELGLPEVPRARPTEAERAAADRVLVHYPNFTRDQLLPLLRDVQAEAGWFSEEMTRYLSQQLRVPYADLYGVITFYALFKTQPAGRQVIRVCDGVMCRLRGSREIGQRLTESLGTGPGELANDGQVSWEWFACLGQCDHAPALLVGEEAHGDVRPEHLDSLIQEATRGSADS